MNTKSSYFKLCAIYFFQYFALGCFLPLFSVYLESIGMTGIQIGIISAVSAACMVVSAPLWGYLSDITHKHKPIYIGLLVLCGTMALAIPMYKSFLLLMVIFTLFNIGLQAINPLIDGIAIHSVHPFGKVRLWGAVGFAIASVSLGALAQWQGLTIIFYAFPLSILVTILLVIKMPIRLNETSMSSKHDFLLLLKNNKFQLILIYALLIGSTISGNNIYFGLLFDELGGDVALIGIAFLLFTVSEAPFMSIISKLLDKYELFHLMLVAPIIMVIRWVLYGFGLPPYVLLTLFFIQGASYALFFLSMAEYIKKHFDARIRTTAMTLYSAVAFGAGNIVINAVSGYLYDIYNAKAIYYMYAMLCILAILLLMSKKVSLFKS